MSQRHRSTPTIPMLLALLAAGCASAPTAVQVPDHLKPAGATLLMALPAKGVQIYECRARKDGSGHEWAFVAPEAELFDAHGARVGKHYGGPHWEANDGSKVIGVTAQRADAPVAGAIPWLLLDAKSDGPEGSFSKVTSVQRLNTVGGAAPAAGCAPANAGEKARIAYSADYYLFTSR